MSKITSRFISAILILIFGIFTAAEKATAAVIAPPANDNLANAQTISNGSGTVSGSTLDATRESGEFSHSSSGTMVYRTVWFQWTAPETKPASFNVNFSSNGFDPALAVYTGNGFPLAPLTYNNNASGMFPRIDFAATAGTTYKIVVGLYNDQSAQGGNFNLNWSQSDAPANDNFANALNISQLDAGSLAVTNQNATRELNEPVHLGTSDKSVWLKLSFSQTFTDRSLTFSTVRSMDVSLDTTLSVYTGNSLANLTPIVKNDNAQTTARSRITFLAKSGIDYYIAVDTKNATPTGNIILSWEITKAAYQTDFGLRNPATAEMNYDDAADISVFRPSNGAWYWLNSANGSFGSTQFGANGDTPLATDYDGDGRSDVAVTRDVNGSKYWYVLNSFDNSFKGVQWGIAGDKPVPGDFDYDGRMDVAVYRPSNGFWYINRSSDNGFSAHQFGASGDIPVLGDFKGTPGGTDLAVFRPSNGSWYILNGNVIIAQQFGASGDKPVVADYDLDGKSDIAVWRPTNGTWYYLRSSNNQFRAVQWGAEGDIPLPGDYDNNSNDLADFAVFRPSNATWYVLKSEGNVTQIIQFGAGSDIPVSSLGRLSQ